MAADNKKNQQKQDKSAKVRSPAEALKAADMPNSTANQMKARKIINSFSATEGRLPTVREFKQEIK